MLYYKIRTQNTIFLFGHRGAPGILHENSIGSILKSIELGSHGVEIDIQITKDNKIILFHDNFIISSNIHTDIIQETNYKMIIKLCNKKKIPKPALIDDLIDIIKAHHNVVFNIEIKSNTFNNSKILKQIFSKIPNDILKDRCIISSFNFLLLYQLKFQFSYKGSIGFILASKKIKQWKGLFFNKILMYILKPNFLHMNINHITKSLIYWAHKNNMFINTYTVNDLSTLERCISLNIDGVFTDNHNLYHPKN